MQKLYLLQYIDFPNKIYIRTQTEHYDNNRYTFALLSNLFRFTKSFLDVVEQAKAL